MRFTVLLTSAVAGLAMASPTARSAQSNTAVQAQERGVLVELCVAFCLATACVGTGPAAPAVCAACLVECLGTADDGGPVVIDPVVLDKELVDKVEGYTSHVAQA
ncbi:hypothetical protein N657DRAFT_648995 [Parathielavia appendiculata]|uniref:Uncharacterized protein n=1 Tax=Parathielavia appendiculata TaxID=2587402 RepID=A0AAN6TTK4_9PEZI|nr:hypothetical protein N657DRAFT_648995 [Parathielavia appendiculata]